MLFSSNQTQPVELIVVGGGPAGFMCAIKAAEMGLTKVFLLEASAKTLEKVRISGGGRCNVTNACWDPNDLVTYYPRGRLPLLGAFSRFATGDVVSWFAEKGLNLVTESDGRMFPISNSSSDVVDCLRKAADISGVTSFTNCAVCKIDYLENNNFRIWFKNSPPIETKKVLLATGGHPTGRKLASILGHSIINPVPSLFSLTSKASFLNTCSGISLNDVRLKLFVGDKLFEESGRLLITHWGFSGPAILRLSAFAAREMNRKKYQARLSVNWINSDYILTGDLLKKYRYLASRKQIGNASPFPSLPKRFWLIILKELEIDSSLRWSKLSSKYEKKLLNMLISNEFDICGKGPFGEEFVTAGGVELSQVDIATMESRLHPGLYFAGEILDIDGVTGGFNFQHCWTSGWLAGKAIANSLNTYS